MGWGMVVEFSPPVHIARVARLAQRSPGNYPVGCSEYFPLLLHPKQKSAGPGSILDLLGKLIAHFAQERRPGELFGDFAIRAGYVAEVREVLAAA